jgi:hypothetical protein
MAPRERKPPELLELGLAADQLFRVLREQFDVPAVYELRLDELVQDRQLPGDVAAYTMWQVQTLYRLATPGVVTTSEAVITTCSQLAYHLDLLVADAVDTDGQDTMLRIRQDLFLAARAVAALDGSVDGPLVELY